MMVMIRFPTDADTLSSHIWHYSREKIRYDIGSPLTSFFFSSDQGFVSTYDSLANAASDVIS